MSRSKSTCIDVAGGKLVVSTSAPDASAAGASHQRPARHKRISAARGPRPTQERHTGELAVLVIGRFFTRHAISSVSQERIDVRAVDGGMAARSPTRGLSEKSCMIHDAYVDGFVPNLLLSMTAQA